MYDELDIIQERSWEFKLKNWPRSISLSYSDTKWLYDWYIHEIEEFNLDKAKEFYNISK